jgi:beta-aspartyl-peptidase (threonine type)
MPPRPATFSPQEDPMRSRFVPVLAWLAVLAWSSPADAARPSARDEIRAVLEAQTAAWNRGDLEAFMAGYWRHDSLSFYSGGQITRGWDTVQQRYARRYRAEGRAMGTLRFDLYAIETLADDAALVKGAWHLTVGDSAPHGLFTLVLRRIREAGWVVVHDHTSLAD